MPAEDRAVYLTFDDGPTPGITNWVLDQLQEFEAKATFFLLGKNALSFPELAEKIKSRGHSTGNHTHHHLNGWQSDKRVYLKDIERCSQVVSSRLFRPPYGRLKSSQARTIRKKGYSIVMWSILSGDFDTSVSGVHCAKNVIDRLKPGAIVVFHDSEKAWKRLKICLPLVLKEIERKGLRANRLPD